jgi:SPP1 family predicted phage head-tail adaptor
MADAYIQPIPTPIWRKDRQVTIQQFASVGTGPRGEPLGEWENLNQAPTVWASIEPLTVRTAEYARQLYSEATHRVFVDYRSDVTAAMRLVYGGRTFHIGSVINMHEANVTLELLVTEAVA